MKVIFTSSDLVFGNKPGIAYDIDRPDPKGNYAKYKSVIEDQFRSNNLVRIIQLSVYIFGGGDKFAACKKDQ